MNRLNEARTIFSPAFSRVTRINVPTADPSTVASWAFFVFRFFPMTWYLSVRLSYPVQRPTSIPPIQANDAIAHVTSNGLASRQEIGGCSPIVPLTLAGVLSRLYKGRLFAIVVCSCCFVSGVGRSV